MLTDDLRARVERQVKNATSFYKQGKASGYNIIAIGLPSYDSQEDHDRYRPEDAGEDFRNQNEFAAEVLKGLRANAVRAQLVTIKYDDYARWLNGRGNTTEARAEYTSYLVSQTDAERKKK